VPRDRNKPTAKQARVLKYTVECIEKEHRTPTIRQIGDRFKLKSPGSVVDTLAALVRKGFLIKDPALSRGIRLHPNKFTVKVVKKK
jgi:SOS-response transcriptional repressor LexA